MCGTDNRVKMIICRNSDTALKPNKGKKLIYIPKFEWIKWDDTKQPHNIPIGKLLYKLDGDFDREFVAGFDNGRIGCFAIHIPSGFVNDGQSIPWMFWTIARMRPDGIGRAGFATHDAGYRSEGFKVGNKFGVTLKEFYYGANDVELGREACDQLYRDIYIACARGMVDEIKRANFGYKILRVTGWAHFGRDVPNAK